MRFGFKNMALCAVGLAVPAIYIFLSGSFFAESVPTESIPQSVAELKRMDPTFKSQTGPPPEVISPIVEPRKSIEAIFKEALVGSDIRIVRQTLLKEGYFATEISAAGGELVGSASACFRDALKYRLSYDKNGRVLDSYKYWGMWDSNFRFFNLPVITPSTIDLDTIKILFGNKRALYLRACLFTEDFSNETNGRGVNADKNLMEAVELWHALAKKGNTTAMIFLGHLFMRAGYKDEAYFWYSLAVAYGDKDVIPARDNAGRELTLGAKKNQDQRVAEWFE